VLLGRALGRVFAHEVVHMFSGAARGKQGVAAKFCLAASSSPSRSGNRFDLQLPTLETSRAQLM
jgi:hypothetical protein